MENTKLILTEMQDEMNNNTMIQGILKTLAEKAEKMNCSPEQWEEMKTKLMTSLFYKIAAEHEDIRQMVGEDIYNKFHLKEIY